MFFDGPSYFHYRKEKSFANNHSCCSINFFWYKKLRVGIGYLSISFSILMVGVPVKKQHVSDYQQELPELKTGTPRRPHIRDQTGDFSPDSSPRRLIL